MVSKILAIVILMSSIAYAEIENVSIEDIKDHSKITDKLNKIINKINQDQKDDRADGREFKKLLKYQLGIDDKIVKKMINKGWVAAHQEIEP